MLTAEFGATDSPWWRRLTIDPSADTVTFHNCHFPGRLFAWGADSEYTCRLSDLRGLCWNMGGTGTRWRKDPVLEVVTPTGRAVLPKAATGFHEVHAALVDGIRDVGRLRWYEYPAGRAVVGLLAIFPVGIAATVLCAVLLERRLVSPLQLAALLAVFMPLVFLRFLAPRRRPSRRAGPARGSDVA